MMTSKEYLSQAILLDLQVHCKLEQIESLRVLAEKAESVISDTLTYQQARNLHPMEDVVVKMVDLESEIKDEMNRLIDLKKEIGTIINSVNAPELRTLLEMRYLCDKTWEAIAVRMHYNLRYIYLLHGRALTEINSIRHDGRH